MRTHTYTRARAHTHTHTHGRLIGDSHNGKILARGTVHTDFSGHAATVAPGGGAVEADVSVLFVAHYIGRRRSYVSPDAQHQEVVNLRRRQVDLGAMTTWKRSPMCVLRQLLRIHVCQQQQQHASGVLRNVTCDCRFDASSSARGDDVGDERSDGDQERAQRGGAGRCVDERMRELQACLDAGASLASVPLDLPPVA